MLNMSAFTLSFTVALLYCLIVRGLQPILQTRTNLIFANQFICTEKRRNFRRFAAAPGSIEGDFYDDGILAAASKKLDWEESLEKSEKPILNLSARDASPEEMDTNTEYAANMDEWGRGQRWAITVEHLTKLGAFTDAEGSSMFPTSDNISILLKNCPQLLRLDPTEILETANWIVDEFGLPYLKDAIIRDNNSVLLSFRKEDAVYGLEFMSTMMMTDAKPACAASSAFLLEAIRGGIQERSISAMLGAASTATSKASQSIASDAMQSFRQLRDTNRKKK